MSLQLGMQALMVCEMRSTVIAGLLQGWFEIMCMVFACMYCCSGAAQASNLGGVQAAGLNCVTAPIRAFGNCTAGSCIGHRGYGLVLFTNHM